MYKQESFENNTYEVKYMFRDTRRKKLRNRVIFAALGVSILTFGIWLNYKTVVDEDGSEEVTKKVKVEESKDIKEDNSDSNSEKDKDDKAGTDTQKQPDSYLIKEVDGVVKVFECQDDKKELYLITSIPFDLLSESDQQMFVDGVYMDTEEELGEFLENFDS